jgi:hypothetical protein
MTLVSEVGLLVFGLETEPALELVVDMMGRLECLLSQVMERMNGNQDKMKVPQDVKVLEGRYGDHQLAAAYCSRLKARIQLSSESLQVFATGLKQFAHWVLVSLPQHLIQRETACAFVDGIRITEVKQKLLMG